MTKPGEDVPITIASDLWASSGMAQCLRRHLVAMESDIRCWGSDVDPAVRQYWTDYADQLRKALLQVETARRPREQRQAASLADHLADDGGGIG